MTRLFANVAGIVLFAFVTTFGVSPVSSEPRHGLSAFGNLKYPPGFAHFDYVNPNAPKGGRLSQVERGGKLTFDSFNAFILKGDFADGLEFLFDTLMTPAHDEPDSVYALVAEKAEVAPDKKSVTFWLRPDARFSDGTPVTAADVTFSFDTLKAHGHPFIATQLRDVIMAQPLGQHIVRYTFKGELTRDLPLIVAKLPILSKAFYETHDFRKTSLVPPVGSGPYEIASFKTGRTITYRRRDDYWAKNLNVNRGRFNFDELAFEYFRDRAAGLENFKAGVYDLREEFTSRDWATAYEFPAARDGRVKLVALPDESPSGAQGYFINTRRKKFHDKRIRRALDLAFDFRWTNRNLFYGLYTRTESYFENSPLKAKGLPSPSEVKLLEPFRASLPRSVFDEPPYRPPVSDGTGRDRLRLAAAKRLLEESGWTFANAKGAAPTKCTTNCGALHKLGLTAMPPDTLLRNSRGETLDIQFLVSQPSSVRIAVPFARVLRSLGINADTRMVDAAQYARRVKNYDFDIVTARFILGLTPGVELRAYFSSRVADLQGSRNLAGIKSPVVDNLIDRIIEARSRQDLTSATHALDRVLRVGNYWIPHWYKPAHTIAYWDKFQRPAIKSKYHRGIIAIWWYDAEKAAKLSPKQD